MFHCEKIFLDKKLVKKSPNLFQAYDRNTRTKTQQNAAWNELIELSMLNFIHRQIILKPHITHVAALYDFCCLNWILIIFGSRWLKWTVRFGVYAWKLLYHVLNALIVSKLYFVHLDTSDESSLIVIVLDSNPSQRIVRRNPQQLTQCLDSICVFANAHLMQRAQNSIAALACHHHAM